MSVVLSARDIHMVYHTASGDVSALRGINCDFEESVFCAIVGRSGSGKSTLLHILGGLTRPTSGQVLVNGRDICSLGDEQIAVFRRRHLGFVFQQYNLLDEYNVRNNICMPFKLDGRKPEPAFFDEVMSLLTDCAGRFGQTLIVVTHDPELAARADRIVRIEDGKLYDP